MRANSDRKKKNNGGSKIGLGFQENIVQLFGLWEYFGNTQCGASTGN